MTLRPVPPPPALPPGAPLICTVKGCLGATAALLPIRVEMILGNPTVELAALCRECAEGWAVEQAAAEAVRLRAWMEARGATKGLRPVEGS